MLLQIVAGVFLILHGVVHLLYFGQSARYFELQPGMVWPHGAWAFPRLEDSALRRLASGSLILAFVGFGISGVGVLLDQDWWQPIVIATAIFSTLIYILCWDGTSRRLDNQGGIGILINLVIIVLAFGS